MYSNTAQLSRDGLTFIYGASGTGKSMFAASILTERKYDRIVLVQQEHRCYESTHVLPAYFKGKLDMWDADSFTEKTLDAILAEHDADMFLQMTCGFRAASLAIVFDDCSILFCKRGDSLAAKCAVRDGVTIISIHHTDKLIDSELKLLARYHILTERRAALSFIFRASTSMTALEKDTAKSVIADTFGEHASMYQKLIWDSVDRKWLV